MRKRRPVYNHWPTSQGFWVHERSKKGDQMTNSHSDDWKSLSPPRHRKCLLGCLMDRHTWNCRGGFRCSLSRSFSSTFKLSPPPRINNFAMRNTLIFAGSSCPALTGQICSNLGMVPAAVELSQFANVASEALIMQIGGANNFAGRNQCQDSDQYSRKGCFRGSIGQ